MNRSLFKRVFPQVLAWTALIVLSGALALAQDQGAARTDGQIEMDVVHALDASQQLQNDLITAATIQGEVTLSGTVTDEASRQLAESIARQVAGVTAVHNNLKIGDPQAAAEAGNMDAQPPADNAQENADNAEPSGGQQPGGQQPDDQPQANQPQPGSGYPDQPPPPDQGEQSPYPPDQPQPDQSQAGRPQYVPAQPGYQTPAYEAPRGPVTIPVGTLLQVRTSEPVDSKRAKGGEPVQFTVIQDVVADGVLAIPRGATVHGVVTEVKKAGSVSGHPELALALTSLDLGGRSYPLATTEFKVKGPDKAHRTIGSALRGGLVGTIIGCAAGRGEGCAIGAGVGVAGGTALSAATPGPGVWIPAEALVDFHLQAPLTVTPVSAGEAARLAEGLYPGGPNLYRRGYGPYGRPYPGYPPYGYPPVYYRPYYTVGGYYYWR